MGWVKRDRTRFYRDLEYGQRPPREAYRRELRSGDNLRPVFPATEDVTKIQVLGAGQYVKTYTLERLGATVQQALR